MAVLPPTQDSVEAKDLVLTEGRCVAFLGAGISIPPGGTWKQLVSDIATQCNVPFDDNVQASEYPHVIDRCITQDESGCNQALRSSLPEHVTVSRTAVDYVHRLQLKAIFTTNFDPWIRQHSREERYQKVHVYPDIPLNSGTKGRIYYLHGYFSSEDPNASIRKLVLGHQSFQDAYINSSFLPGFLLNVFVYENILFIGFNPTEANVSALLKQSIVIRREISPSGPTTKRFILLPAPSGRTMQDKAREAAFISEVQALDITPIYYDNSAADYSGIEELLYSWINESSLKDRPAPFKTGFEE
jgi:hypothetical protein